MSQLRLSNLAILPIELEITNELDLGVIISEFASDKAHRVPLQICYIVVSVLAL